MSKMKKEFKSPEAFGPTAVIDPTKSPSFETLQIAALQPYPKNARLHSASQIRQIMASISEYGWIVPIIVDADLNVVCGHGRLEAAKRLGMKEVPALRIQHLTEAQVKAYRLADNRIAENATWDDQLIRIELEGIIELDGYFEIELTGFDAGEIDILLDGGNASNEEVVPEPDRKRPATNRLGDLWVVGSHRLLCGDSLLDSSWQVLMAGQTAQMAFIDPPYNVRIDGHVSGLGKTAHREFAMASGEMNEAEFTVFLKSAFERLVAHSVDGAIHYACMDWRHMHEVLQASYSVYGKPKNLCVWGKTNAGMGSFYRSQHELVFVFKCGEGPHINNFGLGIRGRHRSNLWTYPGTNTFRAGRAEDLAAHPTVKPIAMVRDAILDCSKRGGIVVDSFAGAGTTLIAAARTGRRGFGIEIDPHYADLILRRLQDETGEVAIHATTGETFETVLRLRQEGCEDV